MRQQRVSLGVAIVIAAGVCGTSFVSAGTVVAPCFTLVAAKKHKAEEAHKNRAGKLRESGMTLLDAITKAEPVGGGPALFASASVGKKDAHVTIKVECFAGGTLECVRIAKGEVKKLPKGDQTKFEINDPAAAAAALKDFTLSDALRLAVKEKEGDPISAQVYAASDKFLIEVRMVQGDDLWVLDIDPATGKIAD